MPSFDVVSELNKHELVNAVDQAIRELSTRFDFKDTGATIELLDKTVTLKAQVEFQLKQMLDILTLRCSKRGVDLAYMDIQDPKVDLGSAQQDIVFKEGIDADAARKISKLIKDSKMKVTSALQGEKVRVTGKSRDDLQAVIQMLRGAKLETPLQFNNFRD
jgi:cyclic-di-GMP-binding protein